MSDFKKNGLNATISRGPRHNLPISREEAESKLPPDTRRLVVFLPDEDRTKFLTANGDTQAALLSKAREIRAKTTRQ